MGAGHGIRLPGIYNSAVRRSPAPPNGDGGRKYPNRRWKQRERAAGAHQRDHRRADHDDDQPGGGHGRQDGPNAQESGEDQTDRP